MYKTMYAAYLLNVVHQSYPALHLHPTNKHNHVCAVTYEHEYNMVQHRSYIAR